ncbi:MAG: phage portal protein, partial [Pseudomonadota bacterium]
PASWMPRSYAAFAREGYMQNAVVFRAVGMISAAVASVRLTSDRAATAEDDGAIAALLSRPNLMQSQADFLEHLVGQLLVAGNAYVQAVRVGEQVQALHLLRPDRVRVVAGRDGWPEAYDVTLEGVRAGATMRLPAFDADGQRTVHHISFFHPLDDHYGLSPIEAAATAIDVHNKASAWNKALLDNAARPSGALVYAAADGNLTTEQLTRLREELEQSFQGARNAGRPLLLDGGLDWKAMGYSPKDMDFIEAKHGAAREIALALGVPPMLVGIPGDATYANYSEANRTFWRQTVLPLARRIVDGLAQWLAPHFPGDVLPRIDIDGITALAGERDALWARVDKAGFLTRNEKRAAVGLPAVAGGDQFCGGAA